MSFRKATKEQSKLRMELDGPSGSGKTYSALSIAENLGKKIAVIDSERGSSSKYSDRFNFDVCETGDDHHPEKYIKLIEEAGKLGYDVLIIDSLSHSWNGTNGFLQLVEDMKKRKAGDNFTAWRTLTPIYNRLVNAILNSPCHVIVTLRSKTDYAMEKDDRGKTAVKKVGTSPEIRQNFEYEMDITGSLNQDHELVIGKTRCPVVDNKIFSKPGKEFAETVLSWLKDGAVPAAPIKDISLPPSAPNGKLNELLAAISLSASKEHLQNTIAPAARKALGDGDITREEYITVIGPAFKDKLESVN